MLARMQIWWAYARDSLWFIPAIMTIAAAALAAAMVWAERDGLLPSEGLATHMVFGGGAEGARGVLSAIAGGLITVTGVVFSVTIVALQLASSQFTPRILRNFTADRANQLVLGVFIGTFTYTLLVLRTVHSGTSEHPAFVPRISVTVAVGLVLVSIGFLIYFINHSARSIQVSFILDWVVHPALRDVEGIFRERHGSPDPEHPADPRDPRVPSGVVNAHRSGFLQAVDGATLLGLGERMQVVIAMEPHVGEFILAGEPLASVTPAPAAESAELQAAVRRAFVLGPERTREQDVEFSVIEIADIAVKALSPGINDPTTALHCIERVSEILLALGTRGEPRIWRTRAGKVHYVARDATFERSLSLAFDQTLHFGADNPVIARRLLYAIARLRRQVAPRHHPALDEQRTAVLRAALAAITDPGERSALEAMARA